VTPEKLIIESLFRIPDKEGNDVDFKLNREQAILDESLSGRDIVPKARQMGISTYVIGRHLAKCLYQRNRRCVIISHESDATQRLLQRAHYMIKHIKGPQPVPKYSNRNEIIFEKTDSMFYIGTAGAKNFGHGDTITDLHCSEVARWPDPKSLLKGLFQAVPPSGNIIIESTGNGVGNWYHRACVRAAQGQGYKLHFFNWLHRPEYRVPMTPEQATEFMSRLDESLEEPEYAQKGLTAEQLAWRRLKLAELDYDLQAFKEQYPISLDECFQSSGASYFNRVCYIPTPLWKRRDQHLYILGDHPKREHKYVIGADPGAGVGRDNSVLQVIDLEAREQVAEWASNRVEPDFFALKAAELGRMFNNAYINVERNNHGILVVKILMDNYDRNLLHKGKNLSAPSKEFMRISDFGTYTSEVTKHMMLGTLRTELANGFTIHSELLRSELNTFVEKENGRLEAEEGCLDDRVMALAQATFVMPQAASRLGSRDVEPRIMHDPFRLDSIIKELENRAANDYLPISSGV